MMNVNQELTNLETLRCCASVFSKCVFKDILDFDCYQKIQLYSNKFPHYNRKIISYYNLYEALYSTLIAEYQCEYVFKNELINQILIKRYGTLNTLAHSEFRVGNNIADLVILNGESKAFEIKTSFDTPFRLNSQLETYKRFFDRTYVVVNINDVDRYMPHIPNDVGIITIAFNNNTCLINEERAAEQSTVFDVDLLMEVLRCNEYKLLVENFFKNDSLPNMTSFNMFDICKMFIKKIPTDELRKSVLEILKKRRSCTQNIENVPYFLREIFLKLNLTKKKSDLLIDKLNKQIV